MNCVEIRGGLGDIRRTNYTKLIIKLWYPRYSFKGTTQCYRTYYQLAVL